MNSQIFELRLGGGRIRPKQLMNLPWSAVTVELDFSNVFKMLNEISDGRSIDVFINCVI